jgi:hypothetical protein
MAMRVESAARSGERSSGDDLPFARRHEPGACIGVARHEHQQGPNDEGARAAQARAHKIGDRRAIEFALILRNGRKAPPKIHERPVFTKAYD